MTPADCTLLLRFSRRRTACTVAEFAEANELKIGTARRRLAVWVESGWAIRVGGAGRVGAARGGPGAPLYAPRFNVTESDFVG